MDDRTELISDYLFGDLSEDRRRELEREIENDPALAAELSGLSPIASKLEALPDELWDLGDAPPLRLERETPAEPKPSKQSDSPGLLERLFGGSMTFKPAYALAAVLLVFVGGVGVGVLSGPDNEVVAIEPTVQEAKLSPVGTLDAGAAGSAAVKGDGNAIRLKLTGLEKNHDNNFYEAWLMDEKNGLISLGTFRVGKDQTIDLDLPVPVGTERFPVVDISLQPVDGKPTHSGVSVLRGTLN